MDPCHLFAPSKFLLKFLVFWDEVAWRFFTEWVLRHGKSTILLKIRFFGFSMARQLVKFLSGPWFPRFIYWVLASLMTRDMMVFQLTPPAQGQSRLFWLGGRNCITLSWMTNLKVYSSCYQTFGATYCKPTLYHLKVHAGFSLRVFVMTILKVYGSCYSRRISISFFYFSVRRTKTFLVSVLLLRCFSAAVLWNGRSEVSQAKKEEKGKWNRWLIILNIDLSCLLSNIYML